MEIRSAEASDLDLIERMLLEAVNWDPLQPRRTLRDLHGDDRLARYVQDWPRSGDAGVVAEEQHRPVGAAWFRTFSRDRPGFGFVEEAIPEMSIGVVPGWRGRGVGSELLIALIRIGRARGLEALSLSVERRNPAVRLYRRLGFIDACGGATCTMRLDLRPHGDSR